ncbi:uncharacterized protein DNG_10390 [Cephalotrichum gorgonifer]|uniref:Methyltransferase domain-containing protein n=1 Tax=Cephalotrichum gorgonifer TaxID=2041049 RepID=A0AAE8T086_9PEZI|nr:uncharacterized protein DNG_10390 [Cephalotrichum gorgonifer]
MSVPTKDQWSSQAYQHSAAFVPKLAGKVVQWLDLQKDDVVLDIGCGDGVLDAQFADILSQGSGSLHGVDSSPKMIQAAKVAVGDAGNCMFEVIDCTELASVPGLQDGHFTKVFSNAAMHWILKPQEKRTEFFRSVREALAPGGTFVFEMGGLGNVSEMRMALLMATARRIGLEKAQQVDPWFFPDEDWLTTVMEEEVGGWKIERIEREWRPTKADKGGVEGWLRLMGQSFFDAVPGTEREECIRETVDVARSVCANPSGGEMLSYLSSLPNQIWRYSGDVADFVDGQIEKVADVVRTTLSSSPWIPDNIRPSPPPQNPILIVDASRLGMLQAWVVRNKVVIGVGAVALGLISYRVYKNTRHHRKSRKARRSKRNGGRVEVVVIAGSPDLPLTKSLALDLERKGFMVYIVCGGSEDESCVQNISRPDIRSLTVDVTNPPSATLAIERFAAFLKAPYSPVPRARPDHISLRAILLIPALNYQTSPIATIPPSSFADVFNTHLLHPIVTIQAFLPLLTARLHPVGEKQTPPKVLVFTPSIISSINPPFHAPEATVCSALAAFTEVLTAELRPLSIPVTHIQLGTFDFSSFTPIKSPAGDQVLPASSWPENARMAYGRNFVVQNESAISGGKVRGMKGSSLKYLHNAVFDVIDGSNTSSTVRIGLGASVYGFVGRWAPRSLVTWMMGMRKVDELSSWQSSSSEGSLNESDDGETSPQDFVTIPPDSRIVANVWKEP